MTFVNGGIADDIKLESGEDGFELRIESDNGIYTFNVHGLAPTELCKMLGAVVHEIDVWWAEGKAAAAQYGLERGVIEWGTIDSEGYHPEDPKSPGYHDRMVGDN